MEANEMPDKIYIFDYNDAMVTPLEGDTVYVREDAFIEKACSWLKENKDKYLYNTGERDEYIPTCSGKIVDEFRKYMEGE